MAKVHVSYDDDRVTVFALMRLTFPEASPKPQGAADVDGRSPTLLTPPPMFAHVTEFNMTGVIMNVFLLDPPGRLFSVFVWISSSNTIGLYTMLDWNKNEYVFIDTGMECRVSSNWSCILCEANIVIHSEESEAVFQYFYPISLLQEYSKTLSTVTSVPTIAARVSPPITITKKFIFPRWAPNSETGSTVTPTISAENTGVFISSPTNPPTLNPFPFPPWYPASAHFIRQWWPTTPGLPRLSCTVVLLEACDQVHKHYVLAQHYFRVPMVPFSRACNNRPGEASHMCNNQLVQNEDGDTKSVETAREDQKDDDPLMRLWYVSTPFRVVSTPDKDEDGGWTILLVAVDFGHAVWIEYADSEEDRATLVAGEGVVKRLRFVTFPTVGEDASFESNEKGGTVRTLEVPEELDLDWVETISIDQSHGAVILSLKEGKIFILYYE